MGTKIINKPKQMRIPNCNHTFRVVGEYEVQRCIDCNALCIFKIESREREKVKLKKVAEMHGL
jgi:hypothetical protein